MCGSSVVVHISTHLPRSLFDVVAGWNTTNLTATSDLFASHPHIDFWRFEVVHEFASETSTSVMNFKVNRSPQNGSCGVQPLKGTTSTVFTIACTQWQDDDGIQDYTFYSASSKRSAKVS